MLSLLRVFRGTVEFEAEGGFPERFLDLAAEADLPLWDTSRRNISLFASCFASDYRKLRPLARRSGLRLHCQKRYGIPFWIRPFRRRSGLAVGAIVFVLLLQLLSSRCWVLTVSGNSTLSDTAILEVLRPLGIYEGCRFDTIDIPSLQLTALKQLPSLSWLTVNNTGSTLTVEVKERTPHPPILPTTPTNVVAAYDGIITNLTATAGQATVQIGDAVTKGSLLISGVTDSKVGELLCHADGTVLATVTETLSVTVPLTETVFSPHPRTVTQAFVSLFGWQIPLSASVTPPPGYAVSVTTHPLRAGSAALPLGITLRRYQARDTVTVSRTAEQAIALSKQQLKAKEDVLFADFTVHTATYREHLSETGITMEGTYVGTRNIGRLVAITQEQKN